MALFSPKVAPDAIPPNNYPPRWDNGRALPLAVMGASSVGFAGLRAALTSDVVNTTGPLAAHSAAVLDLLVMASFGFAYISRVTLGRREWFGSRYGNSWESVKLLFALPVLYLVAPMYAMRGVGDSACDTLGLGHIPIWMAVAFWLGLHYIYLDNSPLLQSFGCKWPVPSRWKTMTAPEAGLAAVIILSVVGFVVHHARMMVASGVGWQVLRLYGVAVTVLVAVTWGLRGSHNLHFHHYLAGVTLLPVTRFCAPASQFCQGFFLAMFVEGIACWGMDPVWVRSDGSSASASTEIWTEMVTLVGSKSKLQQLLADLSVVFGAVEDQVAAHTAAGGVCIIDPPVWGVLRRRGVIDNDLRRLTTEGPTSRPASASAAAVRLAAMLSAALERRPALLCAVLDTLYMALIAGGHDMTRIADTLVEQAPSHRDRPGPSLQAFMFGGLPGQGEAARSTRDASTSESASGAASADTGTSAQAQRRRLERQVLDAVDRGQHVLLGARAAASTSQPHGAGVAAGAGSGSGVSPGPTATALRQDIVTAMRAVLAPIGDMS